MQIFVGRNSYNGRGKITSVDLNHSAGDTASGTVEFMGPLKPFE
jgi:phosphopentomutase